MVKDIFLIIPQLQGSNLTKILKSKKLSKYQVAKDCGLSWRTLRNWERGIAKPSENAAWIVANYLGLISKDKMDKQELIKKINELQKEIDKL